MKYRREWIPFISTKIQELTALTKSLPNNQISQDCKFPMRTRFQIGFFLER